MENGAVERDRTADLVMTACLEKALTVTRSTN